MAPGRFPRADVGLHGDLPVHRLVRTETNEEQEAVQADVATNPLQPRHGLT